MPDDKPLSDTEAYDRLHAASLALGTAPGSTVRADTALRAARRAMSILQFGLVAAAEAGSDHVDGIIPPASSPVPSPD